MRWATEPCPLWYRVSHFLNNYALLALEVVAIWLWIRALTQELWAGVLVLPFAASLNTLVLLLRLQAVYKLVERTILRYGDA
jgi:hypothetical protein